MQTHCQINYAGKWSHVYGSLYGVSKTLWSKLSCRSYGLGRNPYDEKEAMRAGRALAEAFIMHEMWVESEELTMTMKISSQ